MSGASIPQSLYCMSFTEVFTEVFTTSHLFVIKSGKSYHFHYILGMTESSKRYWVLLKQYKSDKMQSLKQEKSYMKVAQAILQHILHFISRVKIRKKYMTALTLNFVPSFFLMSNCSVILS